MEVIFRNVSFVYNKGLSNEVSALKNINLCLEKGLIHGIIGPIGSGKSTLLELMNGITYPTYGEVIVGNYKLSYKKNKIDFNKFRYDVGLVYQFPEKQFFCNTVGEEISFSEKIYKRSTSKIIKRKTIKALKMVGLDETFINRSPFVLNSGEKRRVALASVLISNPKLIILDEPTIGLDNNGKKKLISILKKLKNIYNKTIIIVTHDIDMLYEIVDDDVVLNNGSLVCYGPKIDVFSNVELLNKNNAPVASIIKVEKMIYDKIKVDLGTINNINSLVKNIAILKSKSIEEKDESNYE